MVQAGSISGDVIFQQASHQVPTPRQIQQKCVGFVGRALELNRLEGLLSQFHEAAEPMVVVIDGSPGVGKTSLAIEWARRHQEDFPDGSLFADLHCFDRARPMSREEVFDSFLRALGVNSPEIPGVLDSQMALFRTLVERRKILILLDNVASAEEVRSFMSGSHSLMLVTSRNRLSGLSARDGAYSLTLDPLPPDDAARLIARTVGSARMEAEPVAVAELARDCACLPLALRIAAEQVRTRPHLSITDHVRELRTSGRLESLAVEGDERAQIEAVFSWSYRALREQSALVFRYLGLVPGRDIGFAAISALCQLDDQSVRRAIRELLSTNLLSESVGGRYFLHDLLRVYAGSLAKRTDTMNAQNTAMRALINWYVASADNADSFLTPGRPPRDDIHLESTGRHFESYDDAMRWLEEERANLIDITRRAGEVGEHHSAAVMPNLLWSYFNITKHWPDWIACNEIGLASARESSDRKSEAYLLTSQGVAYRNLRQTERAISAHSRAIDLFEEIAEASGLGYAKQNLAHVYNDVGRYEEALAHYRAAIDVFAELEESHRGRGMALNGIAVCFNNMGRYTDALEAARQAYDINDAIDATYGTAVALNSVGRAEAGLGRFEQSVSALRNALSLRRRIGDRYGTARSLVVLGQVYADHDRNNDAAEAWLESLEIFTELGAPEQADVAQKLQSRPPPRPQDGTGASCT
ncbi:ATP-binding protein [Streptomyces sp. NPDC059455]|uniref:ATP-binding protein n=1 Tax=Streptomyces sp. NPDC059455 TaxID=3346837 RepID=UPI00369E0949